MSTTLVAELLLTLFAALCTVFAVLSTRRAADYRSQCEQLAHALQRDRARVAQLDTQVEGYDHRLRKLAGVVYAERRARPAVEPDEPEPEDVPEALALQRQWGAQ